MKFTKDDASKELVARLTANKETLNLSTRSIDEQTEQLLSLIANDEMELTDFVDKVLPFVKTANANVRNDVSQGIKDYKDKNPIVQPNPTPKPNTPSDANAELLARLEALETKNREAELALRNQSIKIDLSNKVKDLGVKNEKWIEAMIGNVSITEDFNVEEKANDLLTLYNSMMANVDPSVTPNSTGGGRRDYISDSIKEAAEIAKKQNLVV